MNDAQRTRNRSSRLFLEALAAVVGAVVLTYALITGASLLLGLILALALWLAVLLGRYRRRGGDVRRVENTAVAVGGSVILLYALITAESPLMAVGVVALLWIAVGVGRIERRLRADEADR